MMVDHWDLNTFVRQKKRSRQLYKERINEVIDIEIETLFVSLCLINVWLAL
jgi:hypothetical protein